MNTCQMANGDAVCGKPAIVHVMDHDKDGRPRSIYLCGECFEKMQRSLQDDKEINHHERSES
jgi:hypothetical protein